jgi:acetyl-CoA carboxylase carboxyl transferase subunit alpha
MTSRDLLRLGVIDEVIPEPLGGAHRDHREAAASVKSYLIRSLRELVELSSAELLQRRYEKFRRIGVFLDERSPSNGQAGLPLWSNVAVDQDTGSRPSQ